MINSFKEFIEIESKKDYYIKLKEFVVDEYQKYNILYQDIHWIFS